MAIDFTVANQTLGSLRAAAEAAEAAKSINDVPHLKGKLIETLNLILSAQGAAVQMQAQMLGIVQENIELTSKLEKIGRWETTAARYILKDYGSNTFAYELKDELSNGEPVHLACPNCFQAQRLAILQFSHDTPRRQKLYKCNACSQEFMLGHPHEIRMNRQNSSGWT